MTGKIDVHVPILIVGGGAGLTSSILLSKLRIRSALGTRYGQTSNLPRGHILNQRTMEIFSDIGVAAEIEEKCTPPANVRGVGWGGIRDSPATDRGTVTAAASGSSSPGAAGTRTLTTSPPVRRPRRTCRCCEPSRSCGSTPTATPRRRSATSDLVVKATVGNPPDDSRTVDEEPFGPVVPLLRYSDVDEVVARVNDSEYGLGGSVWGGEESAEAVAARIDSGLVRVNEAGRVVPTLPPTGHKASGFGAENGEDGLLEYTTPQVVSIRRS